MYPFNYKDLRGKLREEHVDKLLVKGFNNLAANNMQSTINIRKKERPQPLPQPNIPMDDMIDIMSLRDIIEHINSIPRCLISVDQSRDINKKNKVFFIQNQNWHDYIQCAIS